MLAHEQRNERAHLRGIVKLIADEPHAGIIDRHALFPVDPRVKQLRERLGQRRVRPEFAPELFIHAGRPQLQLVRPRDDLAVPVCNCIQHRFVQPLCALHNGFRRVQRLGQSLVFERKEGKIGVHGVYVHAVVLGRDAPDHLGRIRPFLEPIHLDFRMLLLKAHHVIVYAAAHRERFLLGQRGGDAQRPDQRPDEYKKQSHVLFHAHNLTASSYLTLEKPRRGRVTRESRRGSWIINPRRRSRACHARNRRSRRYPRPRRC